MTDIWEQRIRALADVGWGTIALIVMACLLAFVAWKEVKQDVGREQKLDRIIELLETDKTLLEKGQGTR